MATTKRNFLGWQCSKIMVKKFTKRVGQEQNTTVLEEVEVYAKFQKAMRPMRMQYLQNKLQ